MFDLNTIKVVGTKLFGTVTLYAMKYGPDIMVGLGVCGVGGSLFLVNRAARKVDTVMAESNAQINAIKEQHNQDVATASGEVGDDSYNKQLTIAHIKKVVNLGTLYAPAVGLATLSVGLILGSHYILNTRNAGLAAAYKMIDTSYKEYRKRVEKEVGPEKARELRFGEEVVEEKVEDIGDGVKAIWPPKRRRGNSDYARVFDYDNAHWQNETQFNIFFLRTQQCYLNDLLKARGYVFLNEVYDRLGFITKDTPMSKAGQTVGWFYGGPNNDGEIDFDLAYAESLSDAELAIGIPLDFNVDGPILSLLPDII